MAPPPGPYSGTNTLALFDAMLHKVDQEIDDMDAKIGEGWLFLDSHSLFSTKLHSLEVLLASRFGGRRRPNLQPMNLKQAAKFTGKRLLFVPYGQKLNPTSRTF